MLQILLLSTYSTYSHYSPFATKMSKILYKNGELIVGSSRFPITIPIFIRNLLIFVAKGTVRIKT